MKALILASSDRVDPYINVLASLYRKQEKKEKISEIIFVRKKNTQNNEENSLDTSIKNMLLELTSGKYNGQYCLSENDKEIYSNIFESYNACTISEKNV